MDVMIVRISALMLTAEDRMWAASKTAVRQVVELIWVILRGTRGRLTKKSSAVDAQH